MPACITHWLFAKRVLEKIPKYDKLNECAYYWGAQGPDFLFCHRFFPWMGEKYMRPYGSRLHAANPVITLGALRSFIKAHDDPAYVSYAWGFLCHYALDSTAHPYINDLAKRLADERMKETPGTMHGEIESALDAIMLRYETGKLPSDIFLGDMFPKNEAVQRRIAKLYKELIPAVLGDDVSEDMLYQATADAHLVFSAVTDHTGFKKRLFDIIERKKPSSISSHIVPITERSDVDYANVSKTPWQDPAGERDKSFFELYDEAQELAAGLITDFEGCDLKAVTRERNFG